MNYNDRPEPLINLIKTVHSILVDEEAITPHDLARQRAAMEHFSSIVTPNTKITTEAVSLSGMEAEWIRPRFPHDKKQAILYCHGGGFTCGGLNHARILAGRLASSVGISVFSFAYRLAPEHPYPAQIDDAVAAWDYLMLLGYGADQICLAGDSAGGNLALELCLTLKKRQRMLPRAMVLMSPWTDMTLSGKSYLKNKEKDPTITIEYVKTIKKAYLPPEETGKDLTEEQKNEILKKDCYSPLFADLSHFPKTLIQAGGLEVLRSDSESLLRQYHKCGSYARLEIYKKGWHVFQQLPVPATLEAMEHIRSFLQE